MIKISQQYFLSTKSQVFSRKDMIDKVLASPDGISKCKKVTSDFKDEHQMNAKKIRKHKLHLRMMICLL